MWKQLAALSVLVLLGLSTSVQQTKTATQEKSTAESKIPPEVAKQGNPIKPTPSSIAQGKRTYGFDCAMCHGKDGDGKGDLAQEMKLKLRDYRDPAALKDMTDGELFSIITKGKGEMTGEAGRVKPEEIWNSVNYIRSLAEKAPPPKPKEQD